MTKGRHAASVNAALRSDLAAAIDRADRAERATDDLRRQLAASEQRIEELTAEFHPAIVAERARADAAMRRDDAKKAADEVEQWWMTNMAAIRHVIQRMIRTALENEEEFITPPFIRVMHKAYGDDLAQWFVVYGHDVNPAKTSRELKREWLSIFKTMNAGGMWGPTATKGLKLDNNVRLLNGLAQYDRLG